MAQLVKHPTLDLGSGYNLMVCGFVPHISLLGILSLYLPHLLPLSQKKLINLKKKERGTSETIQCVDLV